MKSTRNNTSAKILKNLLFILLGGLLAGFLWRLRGTHGWGSSWGLLNVGFVFTMFLILIKGERKKLNLAGIAVLSLSFMLTTPAWGTLIKQMTGVLFTAEEVADIPSLAGSDIYCSVFSGVFMMICLGFSLASVFGILLGSAFGGKQWRIRDFVILTAVFIGVDLLSKASLSHWILAIIQPQAGEVFEKGLELGGIDGSAMQVYLQHFDDISWAKKTVGGRNYFSSIETIAHGLKAVACLLTVRFAVKDKIAAKIGFAVCLAFAFSITVSDLFFYFSCGGYHMLGEAYSGTFIDAWSCWEYFTGFLAGIIITAVILALKPQSDVADAVFEKIPQKVNVAVSFLLGYVFLIGVSVVRPVLERFDESDMLIPAVAAAVVGAAALVFVFVKRWRFCGEKTTMTKICTVLLPITVVYELVVYLFVGMPEYTAIAEIGTLHNITVVASAVSLVAGTAVIARKKS